MKSTKPENDRESENGTQPYQYQREVKIPANLTGTGPRLVADR